MDQHPPFSGQQASVASDEVEHRKQKQLPHIIRVEANLLRLPLFALRTKGLRGLDGIICQSNLTRNGEKHEFLFRATRNTASMYPGLLARSAHLALLSILTDQAKPLANPITWSWHDLCRRMDIACSGRSIRKLKAAIKSTAHLSIETQHAIYSKADKAMLCTRNEVLHLYDSVSFANARLPDGTLADRNRVWFSEWYLANLNALFTAPLDYSLWRSLDRKRPIASRLYEFLLLNFYGTPFLRINYPTLAKFLPIPAEPYISSAHRQLEPAFDLLTEAGIIKRVVWSTSKAGSAQLQIYRGPQLSAPSVSPTLFPPSGDDLTADVTVTELRNLRPKEAILVSDFYRLWAGDEEHRATDKELQQARALVAKHGVTRSRDIIAIAVKRLKSSFPDAKVFGAIQHYLSDAEAEVDRKQRRLERESDEDKKRQAEIAAEKCRNAMIEAARPAWLNLSEENRSVIRQAVLGRFPHLADMPTRLEMNCLQMFADQQAGGAYPLPESKEAGA